ncbi:MAG: hypothetical protein K6A67_02440 [Bacteroidales bacterium]|nr:hypothetical protein [Bacteroidales bacterium]
MKKLKLFAMLAIAMVTMTGCTEKYYGAQVFTHEYEIIPANWQRNEGANLPGADNYLYAEFQNKDITRDVMANGTVTADVYSIYDVQNNLGAWNPLPYVCPIEVLVKNDDGSYSTVIVAENVRFEWNEGKVTFIIQDLDGYDPEDITSTLHIRVNVTSNLFL